MYLHVGEEAPGIKLI